MADDAQPTTLLERVLATPLFAACEEESTREALAFELAAGTGDTGVFGELPVRPGYVRHGFADTGERVIRQGDLETELVLVLAGRLRAELAEPSGTRLLYELGPGAWCGEVTALSHRPAPFSAVAASPVEFVALDERLLRKLYEEDGGCKAAIDEAYAVRSLRLHLRASPLLAGLSDAELGEIEARARLRALDKGEELAAQDAEAGAVYLVRSGGIACVRTEPSGERVLAYAMANSTFGEQAATTSGATWPGKLVALMRTELVELPRAAFAALRARNPGALRASTFAATTDLAVPAPADPRARSELDVMVGKQSFKGGLALVIDRDRCIRCNLCVESCRDVHDDGIPRLSKVGTRIADGDVIVTACYSCDVPGCMLACAYGAIRRDRQGLVRFVHDNCVGCAKCITDGCPYGVIRMVEPTRAEPPPRTTPFGFLRDLFGLGGKAERKGAAMPASVANVGGEPAEVQGKAIKCDLCAGLPFEACVYDCPTSAIQRRRPQELFRR